MTTPKEIDLMKVVTDHLKSESAAVVEPPREEPQRCPDCDGTGIVPGTLSDCGRCGGTGERTVGVASVEHVRAIRFAAENMGSHPASIINELCDSHESLRSALSAAQQDSERLDWWFGRGMDDSVCDGSVDLWWADEQDGDVVTRVTHGTSVRETLDMAMRGIFDRPSEERK